MLRYVVLRHEGIAEPHFDLMFETSPGSPLATWRSTHWPVDANMRITPLPDHRQDYLTYEGPLSRDRGFVRRVAEGSFQIVQRETDWMIVEFEDGSRVQLPFARA